MLPTALGPGREEGAYLGPASHGGPSIGAQGNGTHPLIGLDPTMFLVNFVEPPTPEVRSVATKSTSLPSSVNRARKRNHDDWVFWDARVR
jgi:hypothetical protein